MTVLEAARAIVDIANAKMTSAMNFVTIEKGIDPRDYALVPSGGAGPLHAVAIARSMGVATVLVPPAPGLNSAIGLLATDLKHEYVRTHIVATATLDATILSFLFDEMQAAGKSILDSEGVPPSRVAFRREVDMCYVGQSYNLRIPASAIEGDVAETLASAFHGAHESVYGFANREEPTQIVNVRLAAVGTIDRPRVKELPSGSESPEAARKGTRKVWFNESDAMVDCAIYERGKLLAGNVIHGPAIIEQMDTTTVIPPGDLAVADRLGALMITLREGAPATSSRALVEGS